MARKKISQLPLDNAVVGTDVIPVVSDGATKRLQLSTLASYIATVGGGQPASHAASHGQAGSDPVTIVAAQVSDFTTAVVAASPPATWSTLTGKPSTFTPSAHTHAISDVTGLQTALDSKATPADVTTAVNAVIDAAPAALNTLNELAAALGDDANFASTVTNSLAGKAAAVHSHAWSDITSGVPSSFSPSAHAASHAAGGADEVFDQDLNTDDNVEFARVEIAGWRLQEGTAPGDFWLAMPGYAGLFAFNTDGSMRFPDASTQTTAWLGSVDWDTQVTGKPTLFSGAYGDLTGKPTLGTAAAAATTDFAAASHTQAWSTITSTPTTRSGYGITDAQKTITSGTAAPTGGSDGDIYLQYT